MRNSREERKRKEREREEREKERERKKRERERAKRKVAPEVEEVERIGRTRDRAVERTDQQKKKEGVGGE